MVNGMKISVLFGWLTCVVAGTLWCAVAFATDKDKEMAECAGISSDVKRLACYDDLAQSRVSLPKIEQEVSLTGSGKWRVEKEISSLDDSTNVYLSIKANDIVKGWLDQYTPTLQIRCKENTTDAYVVVGMSVANTYGQYNTAEITLRFDKTKAFDVQMDKSTDGEAVFFRQPIQVIKQMMKHNRLLFQFTPFNSSPAITTFDLTGLSETIKPLREACGWSESQIQEREKKETEALEKYQKYKKEKRLKRDRKVFDIWFSKVEKAEGAEMAKKRLQEICNNEPEHSYCQFLTSNKVEGEL